MLSFPTASRLPDSWPRLLGTCLASPTSTSHTLNSTAVADSWANRRRCESFSHRPGSRPCCSGAAEESLSPHHSSAPNPPSQFQARPASHTCMLRVRALSPASGLFLSINRPQCTWLRATRLGPQNREAILGAGGIGRILSRARTSVLIELSPSIFLPARLTA